MKSTTPVMVFKGKYTTNLCKENPDFLFVFGDNVKRRGCGGQAVIRPMENTFGIATKWSPSRSHEDFFSDDNTQSMNYILWDIEKLELLSNKRLYDKIVFPLHGFGTGLAELDVRAPKTFAFLNSLLHDRFDVHWNQEKRILEVG